MNRRNFLQHSAIGTVSLLAPAFLCCKNNVRKPNIIFMMADDLGYGHLGCYGQEKIRTPHIDVLAAEGMRFTQCYAGAPVCAPSRSVLMTGLHNGHNAIRFNYDDGGTPLLPEDLTVAELLQSAGYTTGLFGKWGLGDPGTTGVPNKQGFDQFFGYLNQIHAHYYYPFYLWENEQKYMLPGNEGDKQEQYSHDIIVEKAMQFIEQNKDQPFFLYLPFIIPHVELLVPEDSFKEYEGEFPEPNPWIDEIGHYADQPVPRTTLAAMTSRMDRNVGRIMALLKKLGIDDNTIVFFTSDNGAQNKKGADLHFFKGNGVLRGKKAQLYEGGIRVPMIARWPGKIPQGVTSDFVWAFWDVLPTLTELADTQTPDFVDGQSVVPTLLGDTDSQAAHEFFYWEFKWNNKLYQAVRTGDWKAIRNGEKAPLELYNLDRDISETTDVASQYPEVIEKIENYLKTVRTVPREYENGLAKWSWRMEDTGYVR